MTHEKTGSKSLNPFICFHQQKFTYELKDYLFILFNRHCLLFIATKIRL